MVDPPDLVRRLGHFDLDPCTPLDRKWDTADRHYTQADDGLAQPWAGRVWMNPPYSDIGPWVQKMAAHRDGIALIFARTETSWWQRHVWPAADSVLFIAGRIEFVRADGKPGGNTAGAPSALVAYTPFDTLVLRTARISGALVTPTLMVEGVPLTANPVYDEGLTLPL